MTITGTPRNVSCIKNKIDPEAPDVTYVNFASTDNPSYPQEAMEEAKHSMAGFEYRRMHLGELADAEGGNLFKREWWQRYSELPNTIEEVVQIWDTAFKAQTSNDYSVCATWGRTPDGNLYLIHLLRKKMEWPELVRTAEDHYNRYNPNTIRIEDRASGQSLIQELRTKKLPVVAVGVDQDKWRRASAVTGIVEAGYCYLPDYSDWVGDFIEEHAQFSPLPKDYDYDDQVDTTSMALAYFKPRTAPPPPPTPVNP